MVGLPTFDPSILSVLLDIFSSLALEKYHRSRTFSIDGFESCPVQRVILSSAMDHEINGCSGNIQMLCHMYYGLIYLRMVG